MFFDVGEEFARGFGIFCPHDELNWARDHCAWENPRWREKMVNSQAKAREKGYDPRAWALLAHYGLLDEHAESPSHSDDRGDAPADA